MWCGQWRSHLQECPDGLPLHAAGVVWTAASLPNTKSSTMLARTTKITACETCVTNALETGPGPRRTRTPDQAPLGRCQCIITSLIGRVPSRTQAKKGLNDSCGGRPSVQLSKTVPGWGSGMTVAPNTPPETSRAVASGEDDDSVARLFTHCGHCRTVNNPLVGPTLSKRSQQISATSDQR